MSRQQPQTPQQLPPQSLRDSSPFRGSILTKNDPGVAVRAAKSEGMLLGGYDR